MVSTPVRGREVENAVVNPKNLVIQPIEEAFFHHVARFYVSIPIVHTDAKYYTGTTIRCQRRSLPGRHAIGLFLQDICAYHSDQLAKITGEVSFRM
jgi:hypothetical protein